MMKTLFQFVCTAGVTLAVVSSHAATLRVDPSDSSAYATIQSAVDAASAGDTIRVAPGTYATGTRIGPTSGAVEQKCRVVVDKRLDIVSEGSRDDTFIDGSYGDLAEPKASADAVSCVYLTADAAGTTFRGFTFRDGALRDAFAGGGGIAYDTCGVAPVAAYTNILCRFEHCTATKGGALAGGTTVATLFTRNWVSGSNCKGSSTYNSSVCNCVFVHDSEDDDAAYATPISDPIVCVNCTVVNCFKTFGMEQGNWSASGTQGHMYNLACFQNLWTSGNNYIYDTAVVEGGDASQPNYNTEKSTGTIVASRLDVSWTVQRQNLLMAPMLGDFRPVKGGTLDGVGAREHLALIPEDFRNMDFNGNDWDSATASVPVGAILPTAEPVANPLCVAVPPKMTVDGHAVARNDNVFLLRDTATPRSIVFRAASDVKLFGYKINQYGSTIYRAPDPDGRFVVTMGVESNNSARVTGYGRIDAQTYGKAYYVDAEDGNDTNDGTSSDAAFATLQKAAETVATLAEQSYVVVNVAPGVYSNGYVSSTVSGRRVRFAVTAGRHVWLRGTGGADVTVIEGAPDQDALEENEGCGENAIAGVDSPNSSYVSISGFTFRNCCSSLSSSGALGGAVRLGNQNENVTDCVFSNNVAYGIGAALYSGDAHRCRFSNNLSLAADTKCVAYNVRADACVFENLRDMDAVHNSYLFNCNLCGCGTAKTSVLIPSDTHAYNCIGIGGGTISTLWNRQNMKGCVYWNLDTISAATGWIKANPLLASAERGDYRPLAGSPVFTSGSIDLNPSDPFWRYMTTDIHGNPLYPTGAERYVGVDTMSRTPLRHYVAADGDDAADGLTPATAQRTLMAAVTNRLVSAGDVIVVGPGTYSEGSAVHIGAACDYVNPMPTPTLPSRVVVPADVTLVSSAGAASTVIRGAENIRCAFLEAGAKLDGFTLTGGSLPFDATDSDDGSGAAVLGRDYKTSVVANSLVTGCSGWCAAAGCGVAFDHCVISNNLTRGRELLRSTSHFNCLIDGNRSPYTIYNFGKVVNTTVGTNNCHYLGGTAFALDTPQNVLYSAVDNSLFLQETSPYVRDMRGIAIRNSIFVEPTCFSGSENFENVVTNCSRASADAFYDVNGRAVAKTAPSVDAGRSDADIGETDVTGQRRILNGTVDIGAFEYDWRSDYLKDLKAPHSAKIDAVSSTVVEADGKVVLSAGDFIELSFSGKTGDFLLTASVADGGVLAVYRSGVRIGTLSASGSVCFAVTESSDVIRLESESDGGTVSLESLKSNRGLMLIVH